MCQQIDQQAPIILAEHTYDPLGRLIQKDLGSSSCGKELQSVDYRYTLRGWLTHINQLSSAAGAKGPGKGNSSVLGLDRQEDLFGLVLR